MRFHLLRLCLRAAPLVLGPLAAAPPLLAPTVVLAQAEVVLQDVQLGASPILYRAPRVIVRGTNLSEPELRRIFDAASPEPLLSRVSRLEASEILVPELVSVVEAPQTRQRTVYRDVLLARVGGGRIGSVTSTGGTVDGLQAGHTTTGTIGRMEVGDIDVGGAIAIFTEPGRPDAPMTRLYGSFTLDGMSLTDTAGVSTRIGRMTGRDFAARPTRLGWLATLNLLGSVGPNGGNSPEEAVRTLEASADVFGAFSVGAMEAADISFAGGSGDERVTGKIGRIGFTGAGDGRAAEVKVERLDVGGKKGRVHYGTLTLGGLSAAPLFDFLREATLDPGSAASPALLRRLIPIISTVRLDDLDVDTSPGPTLSNQRGANTTGGVGRFGIGRFEITAEKPLNGIPSDIRFVMRNVSAPVPADSGDPTVSTLTSLGYDRVDASVGLNLVWNEAGQELLLRDLSVDGKDMGTATLRAVIGKVGRDIFDPDTAIASVAMLGAAARSAEIVVENRGLFERFIKREATRQKRQPEDIRREYGSAAAVGIPAMLGNSSNVKTLAQALARFVAKPGKLTVQARAKGSGGYGVADFTAGMNVAAVLDAIEITAVAE